MKCQFPECDQGHYPVPSEDGVDWTACPCCGGYNWEDCPNCSAPNKACSRLVEGEGELPAEVNNSEGSAPAKSG